MSRRVHLKSVHDQLWLATGADDTMYVICAGIYREEMIATVQADVTYRFFDSSTLCAVELDRGMFKLSLLCH